MSDMFLNQEELAILTGRKTRSRQIEALGQMAVPFYVNAIGRPIAARATIEGRPAKVEPPKPPWSPPD